MKIKNIFNVKLSVYLSMLIILIIIVVVSIFTAYTLFNLKNFASAYESDIYKLRYSISTILVQSLKLDSAKGEFSSTKSIIGLLRKEELLTYSFVKDNRTNEIIFGKDTVDTYNKLKNDPKNEVQHLSKKIGNQTVYFGIQSENTMREYYATIIKAMLNIMLLVIAIGILLAITIANLISKPLEQLSKAAKQITDGDFSIKVEKSPFEEVNDLIFSYNQMGFQLNELYSSLELKVQERTIALEQANYKLQETQAMMVHSEKMRSLGELVAGIAHEINNPVNFIHGNIIILQNYVDDLMSLIDLYEANSENFPDDIKQKIKKLKEDIDLDFLRTDINDLIRSCKEGTDRTKNIILDLKNFSRMEERVLTQFDIPKEIDTTLNILNNKLKNRITIVKNYSPDAPKIEAYGGQLNQVFMNIIDNAQDAMQPTGTLTINVYRQDENVKIEFIDTGSGISKENISKVFDPFFTTKAVGKGTGLGMSISYRVIKDHDGTIEIDSEVGKGTKFTITLPINHSEKTQDKLLTDKEIIEEIKEENGV